MYNGMYEYIITKICSKYDITTNTAAFPIMHCVLFAANELNNVPNSPRRVGGEVAFFLGALCLACRNLSHCSLAMPPSYALLTEPKNKNLWTLLSSYSLVKDFETMYFP